MSEDPEDPMWAGTTHAWPRDSYARARRTGKDMGEGMEAPMRFPVRPPTRREFWEADLILMEQAGILDLEVMSTVEDVRAGGGQIWDVDPAEEDVEEER